MSVCITSRLCLECPWPCTFAMSGFKAVWTSARHSMEIYIRSTWDVQTIRVYQVHKRKQPEAKTESNYKDLCAAAHCISFWDWVIMKKLIPQFELQCVLHETSSNRGAKPMQFVPNLSCCRWSLHWCLPTLSDFSGRGIVQMAKRLLDGPGWPRDARHIQSERNHKFH